jgi:hypothetical protein
MKHGTEQDHFLGQEKLTYGHNKTNFGIKQGVFLQQEVNFGSLQDAVWDIMMFFWGGQEKLMFGS